MVWMLVARAKFPDITLCLGDIKGAFLNALMKDGEGFDCTASARMAAHEVEGELPKSCVEAAQGFVRAQDFTETVARLLWRDLEGDGL